MLENKYYAWYPILGNSDGLTHALHDKQKDEWWFVHATMHEFPAKREGNIIKGIISDSTYIQKLDTAINFWSKYDYD